MENVINSLQTMHAAAQEAAEGMEQPRHQADRQSVGATVAASTAALPPLGQGEVAVVPILPVCALLVRVVCCELQRLAVSVTSGGCCGV